MKLDVVGNDGIKANKARRASAHFSNKTNKAAVASPNKTNAIHRQYQTKEGSFRSGCPPQRGQYPIKGQTNANNLI